MKLVRRQFLRLAGAALAASTLSSFAVAQAYPARPVRIIVTFAAGGSPDIIARLIGQWLSERLGQQFVIENRPGAGSNVGTDAAARAPADGYTLLLAGAPQVINAALYETLSFNFIRDLAPIAGVTRLPLVMVINPSVPATTVPEFIAYARENPGKLNMASPGAGTSPHVAGELFKMTTSTNLIHVPYRGGVPALTDLLSGQVQVYFGVLPGSVEHIKTGKLRALAVTTATRLEALPDIPTVGEFLPGYEASTWYGIGTPRGTPTDIIDKLNKEINASLADTKLRIRLADVGGTVLSGSAADFGKLIAEEAAKWAKVVKFAGIKGD